VDLRGPTSKRRGEEKGGEEGRGGEGREGKGALDQSASSF